MRCERELLRWGPSAWGGSIRPPAAGGAPIRGELIGPALYASLRGREARRRAGVGADGLRSLLAPHYASIKAVHVLAVMIWGWSTAVAWIYYLKPAGRRALAHPEDTELQATRDRMLEVFDRGVVLDGHPDRLVQ